MDLSTLTGDMEARNGQTLTGTLACNVKVSITDGATVTLRDATINGRNKNALRWAGINCPGNATIVLEGTNSVRGFYRRYPGIHIVSGKTLTIRGSGSLTASSNDRGTGIGSGYQASCGNITITDGVTSVTAAKGGSAPYSIGASNYGKCGTVTIGGKTGAISESPYTYKP